MLRLRAFMFDRVYLGPTARAEHAKIERVLQGLFDWYCDHPSELPEGVPGASEADRVIDYLAGMTDRFAIRAWTRPLRAAGPRDLMPRYTDDSRERVRDAVDFVELVGARTELKAAGPRADDRACARSTTSARRRSGSTRSRSSTTASAAGRAATSSSSRWRPRGSTSPARSRCSPSGPAIELEREAEDPRDAERRAAARAAAGAARAHRRLLRARAVGVGRGGARRARTSPSAGWRRTCCASSASASRRARGTA